MSSFGYAGGGRHARYFLEFLVKMKGIREAAELRDFRYVILAAFEHVFRVFDSYPRDVLIDSETGLLPKEGAEVGFVQMYDRRQGFYGELFRVMHCDIPAEFFDTGIGRGRIDIEDYEFHEAVQNEQHKASCPSRIAGLFLYPD